MNNKGFGLIILVVGVLVMAIIFGVFVAPRYFEHLDTMVKTKETVNESKVRIEAAQKAQEEANQMMMQSTKTVDLDSK